MAAGSMLAADAGAPERTTEEVTGEEPRENGRAPAQRWGRAAAARRRCGGYTADAVDEVCAASSAAGTATSSKVKSCGSDTLVQRCPICLDHISPEGDAGLPCGHGACATCIARLLASRVDQGRVSPEADICCPLPACRMSLPPELVAWLLCDCHPDGPEDGAKLHERLLDFQARRFVPEPGDGERLVSCPTSGCGKVLVDSALATEAREVTCPVCVRRFCAGCSQPAHPGSSCEEAEFDRMDPRLRELVKKESWKRCPECRSLCERESGCNFMTCPSEQCQGKTCFCYLCGDILAASDHAAHFEGFDGAIGRMGPFGSTCRNRREADFSLPSQPPPPRLSVVTGDDEGTIALRVTWGEHRSEPPTIYYKMLFTVPGAPRENVRISAQAGEPYHHVHPKRLAKYRRYQATVTPVNVNGAGQPSEPSEVVHFHERELVKDTAKDGVASVAAEEKYKRWAKR